MKIQKSTEHNEQATVVDHVIFTYRLRSDFLRPLFFAVPNGAWLGGKGPAVMEKLKSEGLTPGVSDLLYLHPRGQYSFLSIEMKTEDRQNKKDGGATPEQLEFIKSANQVGGFSWVCHGASQAIAVFDLYMQMPARKYKERPLEDSFFSKAREKIQSMKAGNK